MSQFRVEKRRAEAELTLSSGESRVGSFFLAGSRASQVGPERVKDLLNADAGFFPFETHNPPDTLLVNRSHVIVVRLVGTHDEARYEPGYEVATVREALMQLSNGTVLHGKVRIHRPEGHERLSDYARLPELFRYLENSDGTYIVNSAHIVALSEITS